METSAPHTCLRIIVTQDHPNLTSHDILELVKDQIVVDPMVKEKVLMATVKSIFGYQPGRKKIRDAKKLAMDEEHGSWECSYEDLPFLMEAFQCFNMGTKVDWFFKEDEIEDRGSLEVFYLFILVSHTFLNDFPYLCNVFVVNEYIMSYLEHEVTFKRLFWAFKPCIDGFEHCMPVIHIDGTHLYGPYSGVLLSDVAVDGFSHILPLAFFIVESENVSSWGWFMDRLRRFVVGRRHGIYVISDRHAGIIAAMQQIGWCEPLDHHRFCIRHLAVNFCTTHRRKGLKNRLVELASQVQEKKFEFLWEQLLIVESRTAEWFEVKPLSKWSLAYDGGKRCGMMTTNHAKSWNNAIFDARKLPINSLVRVLFLKTVEYFDERRLEITTELSKGRLFTNHASKRLSRSIVRARGHSVKVYDRNSLLLEVVTRKYITANVVDRNNGRIVASASTVEHCIKENLECGRSCNAKAAVVVGEVLAMRLKVEGLDQGQERGIHVVVNKEIAKKGLVSCTKVWGIVNALKNNGVKLILDDDNKNA
ncbi:uncharacterized protein LOC141686503 [Apium graveolens]|uniref:uncharacterized protein LOC141686503 n=1 Tax=Apium graveolens TaxID=4045 RepID=UPI003D7955E9